MKLIYIFFTLLITPINFCAAAEDPIKAEKVMRKVKCEERMPFYEQLNRTSRNTKGEIARDALEPIFEIISTGSIDDIQSIPDDVFNTFLADYMVSRYLFKESFNVVIMFSPDSLIGEKPKHNMAANLPVNKMDDMLVWAWSVRCQIADERQRMLKQMSFVQFKAVTEGGEKKLLPTNQISLAKKPIVSVLKKYRMSEKELPEARYYEEFTKTGVRYRIFTKTMCYDGTPYSCFELPNHSVFSSVFLGDAEIPQVDWGLKDTRDADYFTNPSSEFIYQCGAPTVKNGAIFLKDGTLFDRSGIVVIPRKPFKHCYLVLSYYKNLEFDQMCLEERAVITKQSVDRLDIESFIEALGGFEKIDREGLGFLECLDGDGPSHERAGFETPHYQQSISTDEASNLLPYLYLLRENYSEETSDPEPTEGVITMLEDILADDPEGIIVDDGEEKSEDAEELTTIATMESGAAIPTRKTSKGAFKGMDAYSKQSQREKLEMDSLAKRVHKLEGIREYFKNKAANLKHHSLDETQNILARLHAALSHHGIHATGKSRIRGDHLGFEITAASTGHSTFVGLVLRGKEGFQSGTVKKIIGDHVDKALKLLGAMQQK